MEEYAYNATKTLLRGDSTINIWGSMIYRFSNHTLSVHIRFVDKKGRGRLEVIMQMGGLGFLPSLLRYTMPNIYWTLSII